MQISARETDSQKLQHTMEQQAADHEAHCYSLSATSEQALKQSRQEHEVHVAQMSAESQAALDEASKILATCKVSSFCCH